VNRMLAVIKNGVKTLHIVDGRVGQSQLLEVLTDRGVGHFGE